MLIPCIIFCLLVFYSTLCGENEGCHTYERNWLSPTNDSISFHSTDHFGLFIDLHRLYLSFSGSVALFFFSLLIFLFLIFSLDLDHLFLLKYTLSNATENLMSIEVKGGFECVNPCMLVTCLVYCPAGIGT